MKIQDDLRDIQINHMRRSNFRFYITFTTSLLIMLITWFVIIPAINFLYLSNKDASVLKEKLINRDFIPEGSTIQDILTEDTLITAWDLNNRSPRFFTKLNHQKFTEKNYEHNLTLSDMVLASSATPFYFKPATINGNIYISGDNMAVSPALFSYYYAINELEKRRDSIRIVSIGTTNELSDKIDSSVNLLDWAVRLTTLSAPVKKHTMDYMVTHLMSQDHLIFNKFEIDQTKEWEKNFYNKEGRLPMLKDLAQQLIFSKRTQLENIIDEMVDERFPANRNCNNKPK